MTTSPVASIVTATYNRSQVLKYAIRSVLQSSFVDWEMIIVGDGCTDDTEEVVASFGEPRIRFINLPTNSGNQSIPHNAGVALARGEFIFFLNHDDLYFADHLSNTLDFARRHEVDVVIAPVALLALSGSDSGPPDAEIDRIVLDGVQPQGFDPRVFTVSSSWMVRKAAYQRVGDWVVPTRSRLSTSQEWLFRAWRRGLTFRYRPEVSILCIHAGVRRLSYLLPPTEHHRAWSWVENAPLPDRKLLACVLASEVNRSYASGLRTQPARFWQRAVWWLAPLIGLHPHAVDLFLRRYRKGEAIETLFKFTTEPLPLGIGEAIDASAPASAGYLARGWHAQERWGRWSSQARGTICFRLTTPGRCLAKLTGRTLRANETVLFEVNGKVALTHVFGQGSETVGVPIPASQDVVLNIVVDNPTSPAQLSGVADKRVTAFALFRLELAAV